MPHLSMKNNHEQRAIDDVLATIAAYVCDDGPFSEEAYATARLAS